MMPSGLDRRAQPTPPCAAALATRYVRARGEERVPGFRKRKDHELAALSDEALIEYICAARERGEDEAMREGIQILAYRYYDNVRHRVRLRLPKRPTSDVDVVTDLVIHGAMDAAFSGSSVGEFRSLLNTILERRVVDFLRSAKADTWAVPLAEEVEDEEDVHGAVLPAPEEISAIWGKDLVEKAMPSSAAHRAVVEHRLFEGYSSKETAELVNNHFATELATPMTVDNVDQIVRRFRLALHDLIQEAERGAAERTSDSGRRHG
jgi:DNA-directed RNA polymerase specialized sigma24 family protein